MSKTQLIRKSFNAGELSPELHYRDDLAAYVKGCKHLTNMVPTPYGAVTRRPPFEVLSKIDHALYGVPVRYIPFKFSLTEIFHIVFTDGSGSESTDPTTADLIIFDELGSQVIFDGNAAPFSALPLTLDGTTLEGASTLSTQGIVKIANTVYKPSDCDEIHFINVNDFIHLTCNGKYPVQSINRFFDGTEGGDRWKISAYETNGGPFSDSVIAGNSGDKATFFTEIWDPAATYSEGDIVQEGYTTNILGYLVSSMSAVRVNTNSKGVSEFKVEVAVTQTWALAGFNIYLRNIFFGTDAQMLADPVYFDREGSEIEAVALNGFFEVESMLGNVATLKLRIYRNVTNVPIIITGQGGSVYTNLDYIVPGTPYLNAIYYRALTASTGSSPFSSPTKWEPALALTPDDEIELNINRKPRSELGIGQLVVVKNDSSVNSFDFTHTKPNGVGGDFTSTPFAFQGSVKMSSNGSWQGNLIMEESVDYGMTWSNIGTIVSINGSFNGSLERDPSSSKSFVRIRTTDFVGLDPAKFSQNFLSMKLSGERLYESTGKITSLEDVARGRYRVSAASHINNSINYPLQGYALGVWGGGAGYPYSLTIHDERMCFGGSVLKPNTVFASKINDWNNFTSGSLATSPYTFTIATDSYDTIRSLKSSRQLNILTDNAENTMGSRDDNQLTSATNISVSSHTNYGSSQVQSIQMADMIWFVMGQGERVRASKYNFASDGQESLEMSLFSSHITKSGVKEMSFRRHPFNSLFCLLNNGTGAVLTYERAQEVTAWATITTEGSIVTASSNYSDTGDIIAGVVKRGDSYFLEKFGNVEADTVFLDNQTTWTDANFNIGQPIEQDDDGNLVVVLNDTELVRDVDYTIAGGVLTIPSQLTGDVCIGRRIECRVNPTDISEVAPSGMVKRLTELGLYLLDSGTCNVEINGKPSPFSDGLKWVAGQRESGLFELTTGGDYEQGLDVNITIDNHRHFTLTGLGYRLGISQG